MSELHGHLKKGHHHANFDLPGWVRWVGALGVLALAAPLLALMWSAATTLAPRDFDSAAHLRSAALTAGTAALSTGCCVAFGIPVALLLSRARGRAARTLRAMVTLPLVMPPVVAGVALLTLFGPAGPLGGWLVGAGLTVPFTTWAVVLAQTFVAFPFFVLTAAAALPVPDDVRIAAARGLGASPARIVATVTLPIARRGIFGAALLAAARAAGEFGATLTFAGNVPGVTRTIALEIYTVREVAPDAAIGLSVVLLGAALACLWAAPNPGVSR